MFTRPVDTYHQSTTVHLIAPGPKITFFLDIFRFVQENYHSGPKYYVSIRFASQTSSIRIHSDKKRCRYVLHTSIQFITLAWIPQSSIKYSSVVPFFLPSFNLDNQNSVVLDHSIGMVLSHIVHTVPHIWNISTSSLQECHTCTFDGDAS